MKQLFFVFLIILTSCSGNESPRAKQTTMEVVAHDSTILKLLKLPLLEQGFTFGEEIDLEYSKEYNNYNLLEHTAYMMKRESEETFISQIDVSDRLKTTWKFNNLYAVYDDSLLSHKEIFPIWRIKHQSEAFLIIISKTRVIGESAYSGYQILSFDIESGKIIDVAPIGLYGGFDNYSLWCLFDVEEEGVTALNFMEYEMMRWGRIDKIQVNNKGEIISQKLADFHDDEYEIDQRRNKNNEFMKVLSERNIKKKKSIQ